MGEPPVSLPGAPAEASPEATGEAAPAFVPGEAYYRALVDSSLDVFSVYEEHGTVKYVSPGVKKLLDRSPEELVGRDAADFLHPDDLPFLRRAMRDATSRPGKGVLFETRLLHRDGSFRTVEGLATSFIDDPRIGGVVVSSRDVTDQRAVDAQLARAQRMEAVGALAESVAHEVKNVLSVVVGYGEVLAERLPEGDASRPMVDAILRAGNRASLLARRLLAFGRREAQARVPLQLEDAVRRAETLLSPLRRQVEIVVVLTPGVGEILADPAEVEQVIVNLVMNARDAMPDGGRVTIETVDAFLDEEESRRRPGVTPGRHAVLTVRDTGPGIPPDVLPRIFEPFFTTKPREKGSGLGLSTVYGIVRRSGGAVWAESEPGKGALFVVCLPVAEARDLR